MKIVWIDETESTNSYLKAHSAYHDSITMICARNQTVGRGQRGNSWEAEPGKNLTASILLKPKGILPAQQFIISEATALAVRDTLATFGIQTKVKWPNDIYAGNRKICGILIENSLHGTQIIQSVIGIGLNVNQTAFLSDAPNPVSMAQITGKTYDLQEVATRLAASFMKQAALPSDQIHSGYLESLWRNDGMEHPFRDAASGKIFYAQIKDVMPSGHLVLQAVESDTPSLIKYSFKEVEFIKIFD